MCLVFCLGLYIEAGASARCLTLTAAAFRRIVPPVLEVGKAPAGARHTQLPPPKSARGYRKQVIAFGNAAPKAATVAKPSSPAVASPAMGCGEGRYATARRNATQKPPSPPTTAPKMRSRVVGGFRHQSMKRARALMIVFLPLAEQANCSSRLWAMLLVMHKRE
jgi:hypothetical protein